MASTASTSLRLELQADGENQGTWGSKTNTNLGTLLEQAIAGWVSISVAGNTNVTLTATNYASDQSRNAAIELTGLLTGSISIIVPTATKQYLISNATTGSFTITVKTAAGTGIVVPQGTKVALYCDGTNVVQGANAIVGGLTLSTPLTVANGGTGLSSSGAAGLILQSNGSTFAGATTLTGNLTMSGTVAHSNTVTMSAAAINEAFTTIVSAGTTDIGAGAANYLQVTGTTTITALGTIQAGTQRTLEFAGILVLTHNATTLILPGAANITTAAGDIAWFRSEGSGNWRCTGYQKAGWQAGGGQLGPNYISALTLSNNATTKIDVAAGSAADSTNAVLMTTAGVTIDCATTGANGFDTGGLTASAWFHVFLIAKADGTTAGLVSTSVSAPSPMPSGYTYKRRIGSFKTNGGSTIVTFSQQGDKFEWKAPVLDVNASTPTSAFQNTITISAPSGVVTEAIVSAQASYVSGAATGLLVYPTSLTSPPAVNAVISVVAGNANSSSNLRITTNGGAPAQICTKLTYGGSTTYSIESLGWIDRRGRDG